MTTTRTITYRSASNTAKTVQVTGVVTYEGAKYLCVKPARGREVTVYRTDIVTDTAH